MPEIITSAGFSAGDRVFLTLSTSLTSPSVMLSWDVMTDCVMPFESNISISLDGVRATMSCILALVPRVSHEDNG